MATIEGYVTVYESSDGGSGKPDDTLWQFFVANSASREAVNTANTRIAETMRLAVKTASKVGVTYDDATRAMSQARIEFSYLCESNRIQDCSLPEPESRWICETRRFIPCKREDIPQEG